MAPDPTSTYLHYVVGINLQAQLCSRYRVQPGEQLEARIQRLEKALVAYEGSTGRRVQSSWVMP
jgi:hypothetical protein